MITHLIAPESFHAAEVRVEGDAYRHLFRARRLAEGDPIRVVDGEGHARWGEIARVEKRRAVLVLGEPAPANEPPYALTLFCAALRPERASWLVEKATETGAAAVRFLASERTPRRYGEGNVARWRRVATAAVEQCHRARRPSVTGVHGWNELPELLAGCEGRWVLDPAAASAGRWRPAATSGAVLVGPEGGWSAGERAELEGLGAEPVALGPRVLRAETAAVVASAIVLLDRTCRDGAPM